MNQNKGEKGRGWEGKDTWERPCDSMVTKTCDHNGAAERMGS